MPLQRRIGELLDRLDAKTSAYARHLPSGAEVAVRADEPVDTLSVIKLPVLVLAFRDAEAGRLDLSSRCAVGPQDLRNGTGVLKHFEPGLQPTWGDLLTQMVITSDNTATDLVVGRVGLERVNGLLNDLGYSGTRLQHTLADYFRRRWELLDPANASLSNAEVFERGFPRDPGARERDFAFEGEPEEWLGRTTAREMSNLLAQIENAGLASPESSRRMIGIMLRQTFGSRLPRFVGDRVAVAHKTGDWAPLAGNDAGIIYTDSGAIAVSVFVNQNRGDFAEVEEAHGRIAELLVEAWG